MSKDYMYSDRAAFNVADLKRFLGVSKNLAYKVAKDHGLAIRVGKRLVIPKVRLEAFLKGEK